MEPQIRFCTSADGTNIAYGTLGEGSPLVVLVPPIACHVQLRWEAWLPFYGPLAQNFRVFGYDPRGTGLSDRDRIDFRMEAMVRDLDGVVSCAGLQSFAVLAVRDAVPVAVNFAAKFPDRVSRLILVDGWRSFSDISDAPAWKAQRVLVDEDWTLYTETMARVFVGVDDPKLIQGLGAYMRQCIEPESWRGYIAAIQSWEVTDLLASVAAHTLVLTNHDDPWAPVSVGRKLASGIPNARFLATDDMNYEHVALHIREFTGIAPQPEEQREIALPSGTAIILFADIADSTALTERLGDAVFRERARELDASLRDVIREHEGTPVEGKLLGDGVLAVFSSARQAVGAATRCVEAGRHAGLPLHLGVHAGDVIREEDNVYGGAVNVAARIADASAPGEVLVSDTLRGLARTSAGPSAEGFEDRGERELKGIAEPVRVWAVQERA